MSEDQEIIIKSLGRPRKSAEDKLKTKLLVKKNGKNIMKRWNNIIKIIKNGFYYEWKINIKIRIRQRPIFNFDIINILGFLIYFKHYYTILPITEFNLFLLQLKITSLFLMNIKAFSFIYFYYKSARF